ncbi:MAG: hypothetical protein DMG58_24815 [Acidobacteria bacterium]|nr:MAG: hypothetical protein DMG58_24815 [Acidobacteriota bacterium]
MVVVPQSLRIASDLVSAKVKLDDQQPADLQDGQFTSDAISWGNQTIEITSAGVKTVVVFEAAAGRAPVLSEPPTAKEAKAVVVTSFGNQARIQATYSPVKVTVDNQDLGEIGPNGLDVPSLSVANHDVVLTEGKDRHTMSLTVGAAPILQVQIYSDRNVGSLLIQTGEDGVRVEIDGKAQKKMSKGGQVRITNLPVKPHTVRVFKDGFQEVAALPVEIKKGEEAKLQFALHPVPTVGALALHGAATGLQVLLDQKPVGTVGADGSFSFSNIPPGNHTIELTEGRRHKQIAHVFKAGETAQFGPPDVQLQAAKSAVKISVSPANAVVTYRGPDNKVHEVRGPSLELEEGQYVFSASAPGHTDASQTVTVAAGKPLNIAMNLTANKAGGPAKIVGPAKMEEWAAASGWKPESDWFVHRGGGLVLYPAIPSAGTIVFTARRDAGTFGKGRIQWVAGCVDSKSDYVLFGIDKKSFHRQEMAGGKKVKDSEKAEPLKGAAVKELQFSIKIDISVDSVVTSIQQGSDWAVVDKWPASGLNPTNGKFGFYLPGTDELYISNFSFTPAR